METIIRGGEPPELEVSPGSTEAEIIQNIRVLLSSCKYEIPLARGMGLDTEYLHKPQPVAESLLYQTIMDTVEEYEPGAEITSIDFEEDAESGAIIPIVEVEINE